MTGPSVVIGMSGGVDSSVATLLLKEAGYAVTGVSLHMPRAGVGVADNTAALDDAQRVAEHLGIAWRPVDVREAFARQIIDHLRDEYRRGRTPNPCVRCNRSFKWATLIAQADAAGAARVAMGHYVRLVGDAAAGHRVIRKAVDRDRDQSYFLHRLTPDMLARTIFPLGELTKPAVRELARKARLPVHDKAASQDICFVDGDYRELFAGLETGPGFEPGPIVDMAGRKVGTHTGFARYTIGQRRGLGGAHGQARFVTAILLEANTIVIGGEQDLLKSQCFIAEVNWLAPHAAGPVRAAVRIRYRHKEAPAVITPLEGGRARVVFDSAQRAVTPGQAAVFYNEDILLGGGWIE
ncbi:MAG: tRNA 2-thiouridine(34) synthase MnmA [Planctomycetota bacterium]